MDVDVNQAQCCYSPGLAAACSDFLSKGEKRDEEHDESGKSSKKPSSHFLIEANFAAERLAKGL